MSVLAALARAYDRLPDAAPFGYSSEKIGCLVSLNADGAVAHVIDLRAGTGRKRQPQAMLAPQAVKRTVAISPNFLWDKTAYVLGVTAGEGRRTLEEHAAFRARHAEWLAGTEDEGLAAFLAFLAAWSPDRYAAPLWPEDLKDQNVVFALESERRADIRLHDRPAAREAWRRIAGAGASAAQICLVSGATGPVARLHPSIKGVWGAQSSGASLVSFNLDAFTSYGHEQGDNAPVSEAAAFAYGTALNRFLAQGSGHRLQIGDASTVFWADASEIERAAAAEGFFAAFFDASSSDTPAEDAAATKDIGVKLERIRQGAPLREVEPQLDKGVRFHVLGLAPNAARLSIRFHFEDDFGTLTGNYQRFLEEMRVEPGPRGGAQLWRHLLELAPMGKRENVPPNLAGEWMRAILSGAPYPLTLLSTTLMRMRVDGQVNALRVGILKAVLIRNRNMEVPVALDPEQRNRGYVLGRLFAVYEEMQRGALGQVNATIKDKFYASASATPRKVFAMLEAGSANHLAKLRKKSPDREVNLQKLQERIMDLMEPDGAPYPPSFSAEEQALFGLGYHHQHSDFFRRPAADAVIEPAETAQ